MTTAQSSAKAGTANELTITRFFDAPRAQVFKAWTQPALMQRWWGPEHFSTPVCKVDLRRGGKWRICMRGPDGTDHWCAGEYREIVEPERIVTTDSFSDAEGNVVPASEYGLGENWPDQMLLTITFEQQNGSTKMTLHHDGIPADDREMCSAGWNQSFDKLEKVLAEI